MGKTPHRDCSNIHAHDSVQHCDHALGPVWAHLWHDIVFVDIDGAALEFNEYTATLIERWAEFEQPIYHGVPYLSIGLPFDCNENWLLKITANPINYRLFIQR